jgi:hypothetical protein
MPFQRELLKKRMSRQILAAFSFFHSTLTDNYFICNFVC